MSRIKKPKWVVEKNKGGRPRKYDFAGLVIGASLIVLKVDQTCSFRSFRVQASTASGKLGYKFHYRVRPEDGAFECWRES